MQKPKFKIGQVVRIKVSKYQRFAINSVIIEECPGGTQIQYIGRVYKMKKYVDFTRNDGGTTNATHFSEEGLEADSVNVKFHEIELE